MLRGNLPLGLARTAVCALLTCVITFVLVPQTQPPALHRTSAADSGDRGLPPSRTPGLMVRADRVVAVGLHRVGAGASPDERLMLRASVQLGTRHGPPLARVHPPAEPGMQLKAGESLESGAPAATVRPDPV